MEELMQNYEKQYGYRPGTGELLGMYTSGELEVTDEQEDILAAML